MKLLQKKIAIIGECMIELSGHAFSIQEQRFGGDTLNTALYLSRLSPNTHVSYVTVLGTDNYSKYMLNAWVEEGIDPSMVMQSENKHPALYAIELSNTGERSFHYWRNDSAARYLCQNKGFQNVLEQLEEYDLVYLSGISVAILPEDDKLTLFNALRDLKSKGVMLAFDSNFRPSLWANRGHAQHWIDSMYSLADIALVTGDDEELLLNCQLDTDTIIKRLHDYGVKTVIVKVGKDGAKWSEEGDIGSAQGKVVENVVDTTAAGDSFNAGFLAAWATGEPLNRCCLWGNELAAKVIQHKGAIIPVEETKNLIEVMSV